MGRKAKPIGLHIVEGSGSRLTKKEIQARQEAEEALFPGTDHIRPPPWLGKVGKKEFKRLAEELKKLNLITNVDVNELAAYCDAYADYYMGCTKLIEEEGLMVEYTNNSAETNRFPHPLLTKKKQLHEQMKSLAVEFGLTPSSRARLAMPQKKKEVDPFGELFD
ncbi:phage terminase, small subunit, putative, P27 family [Marininema mesophilum]|uniref:Phage terminase, small subunit, putative, P27 family n=1 Tax=Marininema mesophilum TaxID=1048340 RepID=A0A1H3CPD0_9BACL|nr:phage terminase small subunit P27 family [Marininema mesophilum]SDX56112.1 phage terminase, small subunit, putative, P27 family [Marininema mesophilum]